MNDHTSRTTPETTLISVVLPVYNEVEVLTELVDAISQTLHETDCEFEIIFVNDGSIDGSGAKLDLLSGEHTKVRVVHLSRNFGHQAAVQAGLAHARGQAVIVMDSDLQDDPGCLPRFIDKWQQGYDVVYAVRFNRKESWPKRVLFYSFYRVLNAVAATPIPKDAGNFGLIDRRVVQEVVRLGECDRFFPGLRNWVGFRQIGIPVERLARYDQTTRVSPLQLFQLAKTAVFGFSRAPLTFFYLIALCSFLVFGFCFSFTLYHRLVTHLAIPGWTSITMTASFFGALNALGISVLGEYVVRIYDQVRGRPHFVVARRVNFAVELSTRHEVFAEQQLLHAAESLATEVSPLAGSLDLQKLSAGVDQSSVQ